MRRLVIAMAALSLLVFPSAATPQEGQPAVLLIMDASGSMGRTDDAGVRLMDGAKEALGALVRSLPEGTPIGLRVYGHRVPNTDKANGCLDSELVVPVGPLDRGQMLSAIDSFDSRGFTPIGLSLREAADDLGGTGTIVLVSDGEDTCAPPDPCDVAADLIAEGFRLRVETVGFFLEDDPAREQLQCIADATGGTYREVTELPRLGTELGSIVVEAVPIEGNFHLEIIGGNTLETAVPLPLRATDGDFEERIGFFESPISPGSDAWYSVEVPAGQGLGVSGAHIGPRSNWDRGETLEVIILSPDLTDARRLAPRRGLHKIDLSSDPFDFGAHTNTDFHPWPDVIAEGMTVPGFDEESYNELWLSTALARREDPIPGGTYYIGLRRRQSSASELVVGWAAYVISGQADLYGQDYLGLDGGPSRDEATELAPAAAPFDTYGLPPADKTGFEYPLYRWFYTVTLQAGEAQWFHQPLEFDEATEVEARVVTPDAAGTLTIELFNSNAESVGRDAAHPQRIEVPAATTAGISMAYTGEGEVPEATDDGAWLAATWNSVSPEAVEVDLIVDVVERYPGITPPSPPAPEGEPISSTDQPAPDEPASAADVPEPDRDEPLWLPVGAAFAALASLAGGAWWWRRRRRA